MNKILRTAGLTKVYRRFEKEPGLLGSVKSLFHREWVEKAAISDFDFEVQAGEFIGLIGPNGAGKTTLVKLLTGIIAPSSGEIEVLGFQPNRLQDAFKRQYAVVMGQKSQLFLELSAADTFLLFQRIYEIPEARFRESQKQLVALFGVEELLDLQVRTLSLGERMKLELIVALLHQPKVLFLDEPTIGLDAVAQRQIRSFLREVNRELGTTILLTSHYMEDIRSLCQRCLVVNQGRKLYDGALDALFDRWQTHKKISVLFEEELREPPHFPNMDLTVLEASPHRYVVMLPRAQVQNLLQQLLARYAVQDLCVEEEEIGTVVERIYTMREGGEGA